MANDLDLDEPTDAAPALIAEVERLRDENKRLRDALKSIVYWSGSLVNPVDAIEQILERARKALESL